MPSGNLKPAAKATPKKNKFKIKKGDEVIITTGKDKGKRGTVNQIIAADSRAIVSGINVATKHQKPSQAGNGGIIKKELPIHISNLALVGKDGKAAKIGYKIDNGIKTRIAKKSGEEI